MSASASAFCITHTSARGHLIYLAPFAMCQAFPGSDYYGASVALGVAPGRQSRVPLVADVQDGLGASFVSFGPLEAALFPWGVFHRSRMIRLPRNPGRHLACPG